LSAKGAGDAKRALRDVHERPGGRARAEVQHCELAAHRVPVVTQDGLVAKKRRELG